MADEAISLPTSIPKSLAQPACDGIFNGIPTSEWRYPIYPWTGDNNYPSDACPIRRHDFVQCTDLKWAGGILSVKAPIWDAKKSFDIPHPTKENHRLRYICLEGPEAEVYTRGKLENNTIIDLPDYWRELVDAETIGVTLTPIGVYQELFVEKIEWGTRIIVKNNAGGSINCTYVVYGQRKDVTKNIPEYPGLTPDDYPGDNREYNINSI
jgi:hypothetical protein